MDGDSTISGISNEIHRPRTPSPERPERPRWGPVITGTYHPKAGRVSFHAVIHLHGNTYSNLCWIQVSRDYFFAFVWHYFLLMCIRMVFRNVSFHNNFHICFPIISIYFHMFFIYFSHVLFVMFFGMRLPVIQAHLSRARPPGSTELVRLAYTEPVTQETSAGRCLEGFCWMNIGD